MTIIVSVSFLMMIFAVFFGYTFRSKHGYKSEDNRIQIKFSANIK